MVMADAVVKLLMTGCEIYSITKPDEHHHYITIITRTWPRLQHFIQPNVSVSNPFHRWRQTNSSPSPFWQRRLNLNTK